MALKKTQLLILGAFSLASLLLSLNVGSTPLHWQALFSSPQSKDALIFFDLRLPRTLAAFTTGGLLALAGTLMQLLLQNPLADPYVLGLSSGAAVGALAAALLSTAAFATLTGAWVGSLAAMLILLSLIRHHRFHAETLLLMGVALASGLSAIASLLLMLGSTQRMHSMLFWLAGDLSGAHFSTSATLTLFISLGACLYFAKGLNVLGRGDHEARALGVPVTAYRASLYLVSALLTATAVTLAGCIGFIGLIIPHLVRRFLGYQHQTLLPAAVLAGGSLLTLADTLARTLAAPIQLPVGLCMTLLGVPFLLMGLRR